MFRKIAGAWLQILPARLPPVERGRPALARGLRGERRGGAAAQAQGAPGGLSFPPGREGRSSGASGGKRKLPPAAKQRIHGYRATTATGCEWDGITADLDRRGWATTGPLLTLDERAGLIAAYEEDSRFRSTVVMARHGYGRGEYRYFAYPLARSWSRRCARGSIATLLPIANRWRAALGQGDPFPITHAEFLRRCHAAGQKRPTPLLLRYGPGDYNCLHQDLYGEWVFPLQAAFLLTDPAEFSGGEFVLTEQRPRMQSRVAGRAADRRARR